MTPRLRPWLLASPWLLALSGTGLYGCGAADRAPESTFYLLDGSALSSAELRGKVLLVNFWATTCVSCVQEMPQLVETHRRFSPRGFETVAVAMSYDPPEWVANFARTRQLPFKVALDRDGALARAWGEVKLTPTTYIVDRQGRIVKRYVGAPDFSALAGLLDKLLAEG
ncbi:MAG: TlpA disulfide reductase family protein [Tepidimonas sp.]|uniref:TlpA family protein disulfide reductase n=1 Tax=Tepidimonas sp. TaxID=2002775 RepID=UPI00259D4BB8|nr:TlpA disulfide reductase family protein [Tepidimonas sp.]MDM7457267.1 TlpA disulfide reductase family protein [Tepidimonas sp.]